MNSMLTRLKITSIRPRWHWLVFFVAWAAYLLTAAPTIGPIDSGELTLAVKTLGIAHPTGYPLFTLLGRVWITLMFWGDPAFRLNVFAGLTGAVAAALLCLVLVRLGIKPFLAAAGSLFWAFSPVVWDQSTVIEVYGLTSLLGLLLVWLALRYREGRDARFLYLISFLSGLGLGNHLSLLWYLPGVVALILDRQLFAGWKRLVLSAALFGLGLSIYLYLPLRSLNGPLFNWGDPSNWPRFLGHVTGRQYRVWMFSNSYSELWRNFIRFLRIAFGHPLVFLSWLTVPGLIWSFHRSRRVLAALAAVIMASVFYGINYSIPDISAYFLSALAALSIAAALGLQAVFGLLEARTGSVMAKVFGWAALALALAVPVLNWRQADRSHDRFTWEFASDVMLSAAPNAVILTENWDIYAPCLYLRHQQGLRPDLVIIDKELLRRSWYYRYLQKQYPEFYESCRPEIDAFLPQLSLFESGRPYDPAQIQGRYLDLLNALVLRNYYDMPPYLSRGGLEGDYQLLAPSLQRVPEGLLYRLRMPGILYGFEADSLFCQGTRGKDTLKLSERERLIYRTYPKMLYQRGLFLAQNMLLTEALPCFIKALSYDDRSPAIYLGLGGTYTGLNRVEEALAAFHRALELDPSNETAKENIRRLAMFTPGGPKSYQMEIK